MKAKLLTLEHAYLGYPETPVLNDFSWQVYRGEKWAIVGANGAGKTTLIRSILGLLDLRSGTLTHYDSQGLPTSKPNIGYLPQINHIDRRFPIDVYQVVESGLYGTNLDRGGGEARIHALIRSIGLEAYTHTALGQLSGGQLQRTLLARALASEPELVVLDEPTSFLDRSYKQQFEDLLTSLVPEDSTIIMVTHELPEAYANSWQTLPLGSL